MKSAGIDEVTVIGASDKFPQYEYGICSTPIAYYAAQDFNCTCIFTASHNPSEYVGMKIVDSRGLSVKSEELREMYRANENTTIDDKKMPNIAPYSGIRIDELIADLRTKFHTLTKIPKITIDYSHGAATHFEQEFLKEVLGSEEMCKNKHDKEQAFESKGAY